MLDNDYSRLRDAFLTELAVRQRVDYDLAQPNDGEHIRIIGAFNVRHLIEAVVEEHALMMMENIQVTLHPDY